MKFKSLCNYVRNLTRRDKNNHLEDLSNNLNLDQKPFWRWLKNIKSGLRAIPDLHYSSRVLKTTAEKARALNDFFTSVFTKESNTRPRATLPPR